MIRYDEATPDFTYVFSLRPSPASGPQRAEMWKSNKRLSFKTRFDPVFLTLALTLTLTLTLALTLTQALARTMQVRIKCRDYVKKIAVYKDRLAVQVRAVPPHISPRGQG